MGATRAGGGLSVEGTAYQDGELTESEATNSTAGRNRLTAPVVQGKRADGLDQDFLDVSASSMASLTISASSRGGTPTRGRPKTNSKASDVPEIFSFSFSSSLPIEGKPLKLNVTIPSIHSSSFPFFLDLCSPTRSLPLQLMYSHLL